MCPFHTLICALTAVALLGVVQPMYAAIILDDFIDDVHISTPEDEDEYFTTPNVGAFDAERTTSVFGYLADPVGLFDIDLLNPSQATLLVEEVNRTSMRLNPGVYQEIQYAFPIAVDLTKNGAYEAFFVDFHMNGGPVPPERVRMLVHQDVGGRRSFWEQSFPLSEGRLEPFTAVFPFTKFFSRGGGPFAPPFTTVPEFEIGVISLRDENTKYEVRLDSIRIGALPTADYNGNGQVEQADLDLVLLNWGAAAEPRPFEWYNDSPKGTVDQAELDQLLLNWGDKIVPPSGAAISAVPEPTPRVLLVLCAICACAWVNSRPES